MMPANIHLNVTENTIDFPHPPRTKYSHTLMISLQYQHIYVSKTLPYFYVYSSKFRLSFLFRQSVIFLVKLGLKQIMSNCVSGQPTDPLKYPRP